MQVLLPDYFGRIEDFRLVLVEELFPLVAGFHQNFRRRIGGQEADNLDQQINLVELEDREVDLLIVSIVF